VRNYPPLHNVQSVVAVQKSFSGFVQYFKASQVGQVGPATRVLILNGPRNLEYIANK
jgi:hypothetical protein